MISVFIGTSLDGFIARRNGSFDFLPPDGGEPHGYDEFMADIDTIVIGKHTLDVVLSFPSWPYAGKRVVALSHHPIDVPEGYEGRFEHMQGDPAVIVAQLAASGSHRLYIDGGVTIQAFIRAGLVQRMIVTRVPVLIGDGIPLFGAVSHDIRLRHIATQHYASGLVTSEYRFD
jgi:dihydrofolate reductase